MAYGTLKYKEYLMCPCSESESFSTYGMRTCRLGVEFKLGNVKQSKQIK